MFNAALITFGVATGLFVLLVTLFVLEDRREQRLVAGGIRFQLDRWFYVGSGTLMTATILRVRRGIVSVYRAVVRRLVQILLRITERGQRVLLRIYRQHRPIRRREEGSDNDSYLGKVASHKRDSALSEDEVARIKSHS
jgi:DNA-binding PadR family transcriptional regulator